MAASDWSRPRNQRGPPSPSSARKAEPTTTVGSTNGTSTAACTSRFPRNSYRANTYAPGSATSTVSAVDTVACQIVNHATSRSCESVTTAPIGLRSSVPPGVSPRPMIDATGYTKNTPRNANGTASRSARATRRLSMRPGCAIVAPDARIMTRHSPEDGVGPLVDPLVAVAGDVLGRERQRPRGDLGVLHERWRELRAVAGGEHVHLERHVALEPVRQHEVDELLCRLLVRGALEDADELDLPEARVEQRAGRRLLRPGVGVHHLRRRAGRVRHHQWVVALAGAPRELGVVRLLPAVDDLDVVGPQLVPVGAPAVRSELGHRGEQERQSGRRRRRVLDDEQALVLRLRQVVERLRDGELLVGEVLPVEVEAHVPGVDGADAVPGIELERLRDVRELG